MGCTVAAVSAMQRTGELPARHGRPGMFSAWAVADYVAAQITRMAKRAARVIERKAAEVAAERERGLREIGHADQSAISRRRKTETPEQRMNHRAEAGAARLAALVDGGLRS